jgi:hypothetical protein
MKKAIYCNITINVDETVENQWRNHLIDEFLPQMKKKHYFIEAKLLNIMVNEEMGGKSFALMLKTDGSVDTNLLSDTDVNLYKTEIYKRFKEKVLTFVTFLSEENI